jgi:lysozyme
MTTFDELASRMLTMRDISNWQGAINWSLLTEDVIGIKATEGTGFHDPQFPRNWTEAKDNKKGRIAYHYFHPSIPAAAQVQFFLDYVRSHGLQTGDCLAMDLEVSDGVAPEEVAKQAVDFCGSVKYETKASTIVYTTPAFANAGNCSGLGSYPLWIADPNHPAGSPVVPKPWDLWSIQQTGIVKGLDADILNFTSLAQFEKLGVLPATPLPTVDDVTIELNDGTTKVARIVPIKDIKGYKLVAGQVTLTII